MEGELVVEELVVEELVVEETHEGWVAAVQRKVVQVFHPHSRRWFDLSEGLAILVRSCLEAATMSVPGSCTCVACPSVIRAVSRPWDPGRHPFLSLRRGPCS